MKYATRGHMAEFLRIRLQALKANFGAEPIFGCETAEEVYKRYLPAKAETSKLPLTQPNPIFVDQCHFAHCDERPVQLFEGHMYCPSCLRDMLRLRARLQEHNRQAKALKRAIATISLHQFVKIDTQRSIDETFDQEPL